MSSCAVPHASSATTAPVAVLVFSDPKGGEEALGRVFNALATAHEFHAQGNAVTILFLGAGTRWPATLSRTDHPLHGVFAPVRDLVAGVSCGCADVFGAREDAVAAGFPLLTDHALAGTSGLPSLASLTASGHRVLTF